MSKRNNRSLAVVAGAALALGSMAPAMAARIDAGGAATADIDVADVTVPPVRSLVPAGAVLGLAGSAVGTVHDTRAELMANLGGLRTEVFGIVGDLLDATSDLSVMIDVDGNVNAGGSSSANLTVNASGALASTTDILGAVPGPRRIVGMASPFIGTATGAVQAGLGHVGTAKGIVLSTAGGLLGTGFGLLDGISASGEVNVIANLMGSL